METLKYAIIDDNKLAHNVLLKLMQLHTKYTCKAQYFDAITAIEAINEDKPDFIFLDIDMPNINGFEMLKFIDKSIKVVVTTAHRHYANQGFDHGVIDFLTKPLRHDRLLEALNRVSKNIELEKKLHGMLIQQQKSSVSYIYASRLREKNTIQIEKKDIYYITKKGNHVEIYTDNDGPFYKIESLREIMSLLPNDEFSFVNQSYIFNIKKAVCTDGENIIFNREKNINIKISPAYRDNFRKSGK